MLHTGHVFNYVMAVTPWTKRELHEDRNIQNQLRVLHVDNNTNVILSLFKDRFV